MSTETSEKISYRDIGDVLRRARETSRLPMDQAARTLHIRVRYLEAMETGKLEELPGLPYARGYLQTYAHFLGLDKDEILRRFEDTEKAIAAKGIYFPQVLSKEKTPSSHMVWGGLFVAVMAYISWNMLVSHSNQNISVVQAFPRENPAKVQVSAESLQDVACLNHPEGLYPPCIMMKEPDFRVNPLPEKIKSIMDLAPVGQAE
jgi:cytoskeleton protein RodZ